MQHAAGSGGVACARALKDRMHPGRSTAPAATAAPSQSSEVRDVRARAHGDAVEQVAAADAGAHADAAVAPHHRRLHLRARMPTCACSCVEPFVHILLSNFNVAQVRPRGRRRASLCPCCPPCALR